MSYITLNIIIIIKDLIYKYIQNIYIYKVVISVCLFVCVPEYISINPLNNLPQILIEELERTTAMFLACFWESKLKIAKIVIYDRARVNGGVYYE